MLHGQYASKRYFVPLCCHGCLIWRQLNLNKITLYILWKLVKQVKKINRSIYPCFAFKQFAKFPRLIHLYSWLSLSRPRLSRITDYLEVKIWSLLKRVNLTTGKKYCGKEEKLLFRSNFTSFPQYVQYISNFKSPNTYIFVTSKCDCANYFFLNSANLICRGTNISKYFRESLGIWDNESRLYVDCIKTAYGNECRNKWLECWENTATETYQCATIKWSAVQN